jgi:hypothetical protein
MDVDASTLRKPNYTIAIRHEGGVFLNTVIHTFFQEK